MPIFNVFGFLRPLKSVRQHYLGHPVRVFSTTLKTFFAAHLVWEYYFLISPTYGASMLPTFEVYNDWIMVSRWYRRGRGIQVGDVVAFDSVIEPGNRVIKRVIGLQGDYVMRDTPGSSSQTMIQVPKGHCWVVGDNLPDSRDSRMWGPLPLALINGKVIAKLLPFSERRWIENNLELIVQE